MSVQWFVEKERIIPVASRYDLVVVGAGMGGVSAALSASRHGLRTLLIDKMFLPGGLATLGLISLYLPLCDGRGRQVCFGLNDELIRLSVQCGSEDRKPTSWLEGKTKHEGQRFQAGFNPNVFAILLEQTLREAGCDILYGTFVAAVGKEGNRITHLVVENIGGRQAIETKAVVDASGDAVVCAHAGVPVEVSPNGNPLAAWYYETTGGEYRRHIQGGSDVPPEGEARHSDDLGKKRYFGLDAFENSAMMAEARGKIMRQFMLRGKVSQDHSLSTLPTIPQLRMTRRLKGKETMREGRDHIFLEDSIGLVSDWRRSGPVYEVPFGCLFSPQVPNLAAVGRCVSASGDMWDIMRGIPPAVVTGQAAGTAFSLAWDFNDIDVARLQDVLTGDGVVVHERDLTP